MYGCNTFRKMHGCCKPKFPKDKQEQKNSPPGILGQQKPPYLRKKCHSPLLHHRTTLGIKEKTENYIECALALNPPQEYAATTHSLLEPIPNDETRLYTLCK